MAGQLFALALPALTEFTSPRAWALGLIGIHEYLRRLRGDSLVNQTRETLTSRLMELFERTAQPDWRCLNEDWRPCAGWRNCKSPRRVTFDPLAPTGSIAVAVCAPTLTSSPSRRKQWPQPVLKPIAPHRTSRSE